MTPKSWRASNAEGSYGRWRYLLIKQPSAIGAALTAALADATSAGAAMAARPLGG
jgi:hypothetical protein